MLTVKYPKDIRSCNRSCYCASLSVELLVLIVVWHPTDQSGTQLYLWQFV